MSERGFSAVETAAVAVIIGILLAATLPAFVRYRATLKMVHAREQLTQVIQGARQRAVTQRSPVVMSFGDGLATTNITDFAVHTDRNGDRIVQSGELRTTRSLPSGTMLAQVGLQPRDSLIFDISGLLWPGTSGGSLILVSRGTQDTLLVSPTGMVYRP